MGCGASAGLAKIDPVQISGRKAEPVPRKEHKGQGPIQPTSLLTSVVLPPKLAESLLIEEHSSSDKPEMRFSSLLNLQPRTKNTSASPTRNSLQAMSDLSPTSPKKLVQGRALAGYKNPLDVLCKESVSKYQKDYGESPQMRDTSNHTLKETTPVTGRFRIKCSNFTSLERRASYSLAVLNPNLLEPVSLPSRRSVADNGSNGQAVDSAGKFSGQDTRRSSIQMKEAPTTCLMESINPAESRDRSGSRNPWRLVKERLAKAKVSPIDFNQLFQTSVSVKPLKQTATLAELPSGRERKIGQSTFDVSPDNYAHSLSPGKNQAAVMKKRGSLMLSVCSREPVISSRLLTRRSTTVLAGLEDRNSAQLSPIQESARLKKSESISKKRIRKKRGFLEPLTALKKAETREPVSFNFDLNMVEEKQVSSRVRKDSSSTSRTPISPNLLKADSPRGYVTQSNSRTLQLSLRCVPEYRAVSEVKVLSNPFGIKGASCRNLLLPERGEQLSPKRRRMLRQSEDFASADLSQNKQIQRSELSNSQTQYPRPQP